MKRIAHQIAELNYICFALDVYGKGIRGEETGDNAHLMNPLLQNRRELKTRLLAGVATARAWPGVDPERLAVLGYCFGGLCALDIARASPEGLRAAISVHGVLTPPDIGVQGPISSRVLLLHGWEDPMVPSADIPALAEELTTAGANWELHAYGHAYHAFTFEGAHFPERGIVYHPHAARRAEAAWITFLHENLG